MTLAAAGSQFAGGIQGYFLLVLNMELLSLMVVAFLLLVFPVKAVSAVTCRGSTGVGVC